MVAMTRGGLVLLVILCSLGLRGQSLAQPPCKETISGFTPNLPPVPQAPPRPEKGPKAVSSFIDSLTRNDATFEVVLGQSRILNAKEDIFEVKKKDIRISIAVGNPQVIDVGDTPIGTRGIRVTGKRIGVTDLSITTDKGQTYSFEVHVVYNLDLMRARLCELFPDASIKLAQLGNKLVVEGQARDGHQVARILQTLRAFPGLPVNGLFTSQPGTGAGTAPAVGPGAAGVAQSTVGAAVAQSTLPGLAAQSGTGMEIVNLLRVPGPQQVLLKVRIAELNRTALRQMGADFLAVDKESGTVIGTQIGGNTVSSLLTSASGVLSSLSTLGASPTTTAFGIFQEGSFGLFFSALRKNQIVKVLAEPNLVTMDGHPASFLAGGEFPVPVPQSVGQAGIAPTVTVLFKEFGVRLGFVPYIQDNEVIRLSVDPEVSDLNFDNGVILVAGGSKVPALNVRRAHTVVELHQGETLAIAGLMQLNLQGTTNRLPFLGDLPIIGPCFSNNTDTRQEKELLVLVTPYLVEPMQAGQVPPLPGDEVNEPNDLEFYFLGRIEGRTGRDGRSTTNYDDPCYLLRCFMNLQDEHVHGIHGYCE